MVIDKSLVDWKSLEGEGWDNLLLGNGFSINIWGEFGYKSLYDLAKGTQVDHPLEQKTVALFEHLRTTNFEDVLRVLYHAKLVDQQLGEPQQNDIIHLYENTKKALGSAVKYAHIPPNRADSAVINNGMWDFIKSSLPTTI